MGMRLRGVYLIKDKKGERAPCFSLEQTRY